MTSAGVWASLGALIPPGPVAEPPVSDLIARIEEVDRAAEAAGDAESAFFHAYHRFMVPLVGPAGRGACPGADGREAFAKARDAAETFRSRLDRLEEAGGTISWHGPAAALTPATRARLAHAAEAPARARDTLRVIEALLAGQMQVEVGRPECGTDGASAGAGRPDAAVSAAPPDHPADPPAPAPAGGTRILVDNARCARAFDVFADGEPIGRAAARGAASLPAPAGWRRLCLSPEGDPRCRDPDAHATVYLHDGFTVQPHCPALSAPPRSPPPSRRRWRR